MQYSFIWFPLFHVCAVEVRAQMTKLTQMTFIKYYAENILWLGIQDWRWTKLK